MSEADRVFPARKGQGSQTLTSEKRLILSAPRRSGPGSGKSRVVEVVHLRRDRSRPAEDQPRSAPWSVRVEAWPEKHVQPLPPQGTQPTAPEPAPPVVHVMPMWEPSQPQPLLPETKSRERQFEAEVPKQRLPRVPPTKTPEESARHFADPFAGGDDGANCFRCGYLVGPAREKRGLLTCSTCG
jgi:hypothetical protein